MGIPLFNLGHAEQRWVDETLAGMTIAQKLGQMVCENHRKLPEGAALEAFMGRYPIGHAFVGSEIIDPNEDNVHEVRAKCDSIRRAAEPEQHLLLCGDFEHGTGGTVSSLTRFPNPLALGAAGDPDLAYAEGKAIALEARSLGVRWAYAPVADLNINLNNPVVNHRAFGDDPDRVLPLLKACIRGMQDHGFAACAKHFPGDGTDDRNQHQVTSLNVLSLEDWRRRHGRVFKELIEDGVLSIMIGHIGFPAYEPADARGLYLPATVSRKIMTDLLRKELGFQGIIVTDALSMCGFCSFAPYEQRMLDCFNGGADVFLWPETARFYELMLPALADGRASMERLDESARRVLAFKARLGLIENSGPIPISSDAVAENRAAATRVAERSVTLLRNRRNLLPLAIAQGEKVLLLKSEHMPDCRILNAERFAPFFRAFETRGAVITVDTFDKFRNYRARLDEFALVVLMEHVTTTNAAGNLRALGPIWDFMAHPCERKLLISFGTPYFLHDMASADTYINAYCNSNFTQDAVMRAIVGEIPFRGVSPVDCAYEFKRGDGIVGV